PTATLETVLLRAEAPTGPRDLGWPRAFYANAVRHAREIRNRYTFLDLAANSGQLDDVTDL
ncbi:MAG: sn-glycerol-1-phosphate dehydrogenase, partial [Planctomycetota bacterium]